MKSLEELVKIRDEALKKDNQLPNTYRVKLTIGMATCGITAGARPIFTALLEALANWKCHDVKIEQTGCFGNCDQEPMMSVAYMDQPPQIYGKLTPESAVDILKRILEQSS